MVATCSPIALAGQTPRNALYEQTSPGLKDLSALARQRSTMLGYPINLNFPPAAFFKWREKLNTAGLDQFNFNNVGDPFKKGHFSYNTHDFEKELIERFGTIYGFAQKKVWGFLSNSGTDSNMHGIYIGRTLLHYRTGTLPKIYFTREAHYSIQILSNVMNLDRVVVDTEADGSMDISDLEQKLSANTDYPALVVATVGTTFKGAIDSIDGIQSKLKGRDYYLHLDAALFGGYLPHTPFADELLQIRRTDQSPRYHSIAVSCHKFFGYPSPAGLFMTSQEIFEEFEAQFAKIHDPQYILQVPGTITCSRDSVKPAEFYFFSSDSELSRQKSDARLMLDNAGYLHKEMLTHLKHLEPERTGQRSPIVYFRKPSEEIVDRYTLAVMQSDRKHKTTAYAHVVVMPHVSKKTLDRFLEDLSRQ
ncbi:histidine decarboxylase [Nitrosomonas marina]|uniref:Histidine decarboxylase n=1 Tax=Nitrosomonas marina TaxID=917 RepID=A0A1H8APM6_9PROT|nr:histidine decarboxylase [Nitrosomonas marina]